MSDPRNLIMARAIREKLIGNQSTSHKDLPSVLMESLWLAEGTFGPTT